MVGIVKVHDFPPKNYAPKADLQNHLGDSAVLTRNASYEFPRILKKILSDRIF